MSRWTVLDSRYALKLPFFALRVDRVRTGRGVVLDEYPVIESRDWVCVVCLDAQYNAVMVRQYRHGCAQITLEFPAGGIDPGEPPLAAAQRELREETGYEAEQWTLLRSVSPDTTRHHSRAHIFLATGARLAGDQHLEPAEDVSVELKPWAQAETLRSELTHAVHVLALMLALESLQDR